jgi:predicted transposase/invertase (TIGR01784 family)
MSTTRSMISFDWAMKRLLRQKANFEVLEGFLSELLSRKTIIKNIGESEGNQTDKDRKINKVDILVEMDDKELVIIELQYNYEIDYFERMLFGTGKVITDYLHKGEPYSNVRKVYSVNIVYFELGKGDDYVYHGFTYFTGLHTKNQLELDDKQKNFCHKTYPGELYPEYYIIKVMGFNDAAKDTLDEWIYYLKNNRIKDEHTAKGLDKARKILAYDNLSDEEKQEYDRIEHLERIKLSEIRSALIQGRSEGEEERIRLQAEKEAIQAEKDTIQAKLKEKEIKEAALLARIAELEQNQSDNTNKNN